MLKPSWRKWPLVSLVMGITFSTICLVVLTATPSTAYTQADRDEQKRYSIETVSMTYAAFLVRKTNFGKAGCRKENHKYQGMPTPGCNKPSPYNAFDWTDDGCSGANSIIGPLSNFYRGLFNKPCQLHDFGYRNLGSGLQLDRNDERRAWIDSRFLSEMRRICNDRYPRAPRSLASCHAKALLVYSAVRNFSNWSRPGGGLRRSIQRPIQCQA